MRALGLALTGGVAITLAASVAWAGDAAPASGPAPSAPVTPPAASSAPPGAAPPLADDAKIEFAEQPPEGKVHDENPSAVGEPPPMRPRRPGVVVESTLGVLGFGGRFRNVAPPAYWFHTQLGYELLSWLMVYAEGEVALTDSGESQDPSHTKAFPLWGFGGGLRATIHATARVAFYLQGEAGALTADVPHGELAVLGFRNAESLNLTAGGRLGAEWYQMDRHLALLVAAGGRYASGFAKVVGPSDFPLMWDAALGLRYVF